MYIHFKRFLEPISTKRIIRFCFMSKITLKSQDNIFGPDCFGQTIGQQIAQRMRFHRTIKFTSALINQRALLE